ncbi:bombyxin A-2 homolog [Planococcus citri]|uniref:bombyxin A-2 homolog n=1 Tax=Planococcus citri TaxID=170843 RepID=UPI0031F86E76
MTSIITITILIAMPVYIFGYERNKNEPIKACGSALAEVVASVCDSVYNLQKRGDAQNDDLEPEYYYNHEMFIDTDSSYPFRSKRSAALMFKPFRGNKRNGGAVSIVHECCMKSCTVNELTGYCG